MPAPRKRELWPVTIQLTEEQRRWLLKQTSTMTGYSALVRQLIDEARFANP